MFFVVKNSLTEEEADCHFFLLNLFGKSLTFTLKGTPAFADQGRGAAAGTMKRTPMGTAPPKLDVPKHLPVIPGEGVTVVHGQTTKQPISNVSGAGHNPFREGILSREHLAISFRVWLNSPKAYQMLSASSKTW